MRHGGLPPSLHRHATRPRCSNWKVRTRERARSDEPVLGAAGYCCSYWGDWLTRRRGSAERGFASPSSIEATRQIPSTTSPAFWHGPDESRNAATPSKAQVRAPTRVKGQTSSRRRLLLHQRARLVFGTHPRGSQPIRPALPRKAADQARHEMRGLLHHPGAIRQHLDVNAIFRGRGSRGQARFLVHGPNIKTKSRVEVWRGGLGRCLCSLLARPFVCGCHIISTMLRFHTPLIKPGGRISRTRLSDKACEMAIHTRSPTNRCRFVR